MFGFKRNRIIGKKSCCNRKLWNISQAAWIWERERLSGVSRLTEIHLEKPKNKTAVFPSHSMKYLARWLALSLTLMLSLRTSFFHIYEVKNKHFFTCKRGEYYSAFSLFMNRLIKKIKKIIHVYKNSVTAKANISTRYVTQQANIFPSHIKPCLSSIFHSYCFS